MFTTKPDTTVKKLQDLVNEWSALFEKPVPLDIRFCVTPDNLLTINGTALCPVSEIDADNATYDVEYLQIPTIAGSYYEVYLHCPFGGPCEIGYIHLISTVYSAGSLESA